MLALVQIAALLGVVAICVAVVLLVLQVRRTLDDASAKLQTITTKVALDLDEAHRLELEAGLTAMEARKASAEERAALPKLTAQASQAMRSLDGWVVTARNTTSGVGVSQQQIAARAVAVLATTDTTVRQLQPVMQQAQLSLVRLQAVETDLDRQVNDPAIARSLKHIDGTTASLEASAKDVQQEVHAITHPTWVHRVWRGVLDVARVFNPL